MARVYIIEAARAVFVFACIMAALAFVHAIMPTP